MTGVLDLLRFCGPHCTSALVVSCGEGEEAVQLARSLRLVSCVESDPEQRAHLQQLALKWPALTVMASLPHEVDALYDVLVVPSRALHAMPRPVNGLRRLRRRLKEGGAGLISCDGAQAHAGAAQVRSLVAMLTTPSDDETTKLQVGPSTTPLPACLHAN